jgi:hypothetical protein
VPAGREDVVILRAGGLIVSDSAAVAEPEALSVTFTVMLADPAAVGLPEIVPPADKFSPAGSVPLASDQEYGSDPPEALSVCEYATLTVPVGNDEVVMLRAGGLIVSESAAVFDPDELSVTFTVMLDDPAAVGMPDIVPLVAKLSPAGQVPLASDQEYGGTPPDALSVCE